MKLALINTVALAALVSGHATFQQLWVDGVDHISDFLSDFL